MPLSRKLTSFQRSDIRDAEATAHIRAFTDGLHAIRAHLALPKFAGVDESGRRKDWIATGDVDRMILALLSDAQSAADEAHAEAFSDVLARAAAL